MQDHKYFKALLEQMEDSGREALMWYLMNEVDISEVNLKKAPQTKALVEQKERSFTPEQSFIFEFLKSKRWKQIVPKVKKFRMHILKKQKGQVSNVGQVKPN